LSILEKLLQEAKSKIEPVKVEVSSTSERFNLLMRKRKPETKAVYVSLINLFLQFSKDKVLDEWTVRKFFEWMDKKGYAPTTQRIAWYALKKYFKARGIPWELDGEDYPEVDRSELKKPTLTREEVVRMIEVTKKNGFPEEKVLLALCSTFALRRAEFCSIDERCIDRKDHTLFVKAKKGGEARYHFIPEEIRWCIYPWNFNKRVPLSTASAIFDAILAKAKIKKKERMNIHSLRRSVITELCSTNLPPMRVYNFARWKRREFGMLTEYDNPKFRETDLLIYEKHPFLSYWR